jgi:hypothetical protein
MKKSIGAKLKEKNDPLGVDVTNNSRVLEEPQREWEALAFQVSIAFYVLPQFLGFS